jgi:hypothetical protein
MQKKTEHFGLKAHFLAKKHMMFTLFFSPFSAVSTPIFAISYALESC